jgi:hypothetical protein
LLRQLVQEMPEPPRLVAARGGIENDANAHPPMILFPRR